MTTQSGTVLTNTLNPLSTTLNVGTSSTDITIGSSSTTTTINRITNVKVLKPKVYVWTTQIVSPTVADFLTNGTIINSTYSSANPSTVNDNIQVNLPIPTAQLEGMYFFLRKMRGAINGSTINWTFSTSPASIVSISTSANATGSPVASITQTNLFLRMVVCGYGGTYYWTFI